MLYFYAIIHSLRIKIFHRIPWYSIYHEYETLEAGTSMPLFIGAGRDIPF